MFMLQLVLKAGASGFLSKTSSTSSIKRAILKVFKGGIYLSSAMARKLTLEKNQDKTDILSKLSTREFEVLNLFVMGVKITKLHLS